MTPISEEEEFEFMMMREQESESTSSGWQEYEPLAADKKAMIAGSLPGNLASGATLLGRGSWQLGTNIGDYIGSGVPNTERGYKKWLAEQPVSITPGAIEGMQEAGIEVPDQTQYKLGEAVNKWEKEFTESQAKGLRVRGKGGFNEEELIGALFSPVNIIKTGVTKAAPLTKEGEKIAQTIWKQTTHNMGNASKVGALYGTGMPVTDGGENYAATKGLQTGLGYAAGAVLPAVAGTARASGRFLDQLTRSMGFRNTPGNFWDKIQKAPGIYTDVKEIAVALSGKDRLEVIEILKNAKPGETSKQALARYSRENVSQAGPKQPNAVGVPMMKVLDEVKSAAPVSTEAGNLYRGQATDRLGQVQRIAKAKFEQDADLALRSSNATKGYNPKVMGAKVDPRSNTQLLDAMANKAQEKALKAEMSKAQAMQDWGRFETLKVQLNQLSLGKPPIQNVPGKSSLRTQSARDTSLQTESAPGIPMKPTMAPVRPVAQPEVPNMYNSPRYRGEVPGPSRYAPQRPISQEAGRAATEAKAIASQRLVEQQTHSGISQQMLLNMKDESGKSFAEFASKPAVIKAIEDAKIAALNKGTYFPSKPADQYSVANLQRIKRSLADDIKLRKDDGKLGDTERKELTNIVQSFTKWLRAKSPKFADADDQFLADSAAINQSKAGKIMEDSLVRNEVETPLRYLAAIDKPKNAEAFKALTQGQKDIRDTIAEQLLTNKRVTELASPKNIQPILPTLQGEVMPNVANPLYRPLMILRAGLRHVSKDKFPEYEKLIWSLEKDPKNLIKILKLPDADPTKQWVLEAIKKGGAIGTAQSTSQGAN